MRIKLIELDKDFPDDLTKGRFIRGIIGFSKHVAVLMDPTTGETYFNHIRNIRVEGHLTDDRYFLDEIVNRKNIEVLDQNGQVIMNDPKWGADLAHRFVMEHIGIESNEIDWEDGERLLREADNPEPGDNGD